MKGKVVVITGASAGVGRAAAHAFARQGAHVALLARDQARLEESRKEVEAMGGQALTIALDVADADAVEQAAERIERDAGPIEVWVNNAMATIFAPIEDISPGEFKRVTDVTYLGTVHGTMAALKRMRSRNRGTIIQVGSALAYRSIPLQSAYCGAKHAIRGFTDSIRSELLHDGSAVHLCMVQLPGVNTPQFEWCRTSSQYHPQPVGPVYQPEVAAHAIAWAAQHQRREIYVGLPSVVTIVLNKCFPGLLDKYLASHAYSQQFSDVPIAGRPDNLFQPVATPYQTHGSFEDKAHRHSPQLWTSLHRNLLGWTVGVIAAAAFLRSRQKKA